MPLNDYDKNQLGLANTGSVSHPQTADHYAKKAVAESQRLKSSAPLEGASNNMGSRELWKHRME